MCTGSVLITTAGVGDSTTLGGVAVGVGVGFGDTTLSATAQVANRHSSHKVRIT